MTITSTIKTIAATALTIALVRPAAAQNAICSIYPTRCEPYSGPQAVGPLGLRGYPGVSPVYTPGVLAPAMSMVVHDAVNSLPPAVRQALYPSKVAQAVRSGAVDAAIKKSLRNGFDPYARIINGTGPGGAFYTNKAAMAVLNGTSPIWKSGAAISTYAIPLEQSAQAARARQQNALTLQQMQRTLQQMQRVLQQRGR